MRVFLESAALDAIRWSTDARLADGVLVTPGTLDRDAFGIEPQAQLEAIARLAPGPVLATVGAVAGADLHRIGRAYAKVGEQVIVAVPFIEDGVAAIKRLVNDGCRVAATFIATPAQAVFAAKLGAAYALVLTGELDAAAQDPHHVLREARAIFDRHDVECELIALGVQDSRACSGAFSAGADGVAMTPETLRAVLRHPVTDHAVDRMLGELSRRPRPRKR